MFPFYHCAEVPAPSLVSGTDFAIGLSILLPYFISSTHPYVSHLGVHMAGQCISSSQAQIAFAVIGHEKHDHPVLFLTSHSSLFLVASCFPSLFTLFLVSYISLCCCISNTLFAHSVLLIRTPTFFTPPLITPCPRERDPTFFFSLYFTLILMMTSGHNLSLFSLLAALFFHMQLWSTVVVQAAPHCGLVPPKMAQVVAQSSSSTGRGSGSTNDVVATGWYPGWLGASLPPNKISWTKYGSLTFAFA